MKPITPVLLLALLLAAPTLGADTAILIEPNEVMMDEAVVVRVTGLAPGSECTVRARAALTGKLMQAVATFKADPQGVVDVSKQAPLKGTYAGVSPMGLLWSMDLLNESAEGSPTKISDARVTTFEVESDGRSLAKAQLKRWFVRPGVRRSEVKVAGLVGRLFEPAGPGKRPGLLVLSGSEGGFNENEAALLASHGYVALALAYFGVEGTSRQLVEIPLEYLKKGVNWLATQGAVDSSRLGVVGGSKGGELSLLLASNMPELSVVVARAPSNVAWFALGGTYRQSSWTLEGKPVPYIQPSPLLFPQVLTKTPIRFVDLYGPALNDEASVKKALIPVEKINGAALLITGTDDLMWPASRMADQVVARLKEHKHRFPVEHLKYEGAGHAIPNAYVRMQGTVESGRMAFGGTAAANARAMADSRPRVLRFLEENLKVR